MGSNMTESRDDLKRVNKASEVVAECMEWQAPNGLTKLTHGMRTGEIFCIKAGVKAGKSSLVEPYEEEDEVF